MRPLRLALLSRRGAINGGQARVVVGSGSHTVCRGAINGAQARAIVRFGPDTVCRGAINGAQVHATDSVYMSILR